jgi:hypothetical protein
MPARFNHNGNRRQEGGGRKRMSGVEQLVLPAGSPEDVLMKDLALLVKHAHEPHHWTVLSSPTINLSGYMFSDNDAALQQALDRQNIAYDAIPGLKAYVIDSSAVQQFLESDAVKALKAKCKAHDDHVKTGRRAQDTRDFTPITAMLRHQMLDIVQHIGKFQEQTLADLNRALNEVCSADNLVIDAIQHHGKHTELAPTHAEFEADVAALTDARSANLSAKGKLTGSQYAHDHGLASRAGKHVKAYFEARAVKGKEPEHGL